MKALCFHKPCALTDAGIVTVIGDCRGPCPPTEVVRSDSQDPRLETPTSARTTNGHGLGGCVSTVWIHDPFAARSAGEHTATAALYASKLQNRALVLLEALRAEMVWRRIGLQFFLQRICQRSRTECNKLVALSHGLEVAYARNLLLQLLVFFTHGRYHVLQFEKGLLCRYQFFQEGPRVPRLPLPSF